MEALPPMPVDKLREGVLEDVNTGRRIVSFFGTHLGRAPNAGIVAVVADDVDGTLIARRSHPVAAYSALTPECPQAHVFERELYEQTGVLPEGHPWLKPVRGHTAVAHDYFAMEGDEVHEVAVGPVHAGVIEPGHFRFQAQGEVVHHLEVHLGYQHRGVEEALAGGPHRRTIAQMETLAGDTSIGHATAYCLAAEALASGEAPPRAQALRAIALELERLANHVGDMGALANDVGFLPTAAFCGRLRGEFLNATAEVCGSRLGRGLVRPGGVAFDVDAAMTAALHSRLAKAGEDLRHALDQFFHAASVRGRLDGTGVVSTEACRDLGLVGVAARACGIPLDSRVDHPAGWYGGHPVLLSTWVGGDVAARAMVRAMEIERSLAFVQDQLGRLPGGPLRSVCGPLTPDSLAVALVEGWRGEIAHVAITGPDGRYLRYKVTDPSFHNWTGLALALRGQQISDFPLCNKSFNLSYCGVDL
jgi:Ni,Fe-hydrogenase III large subunit